GPAYLFDLFGRFLYAILAEVGDAGIHRLLNQRRPYRFGNGDQGNVFGLAARSQRSPPDCLVNPRDLPANVFYHLILNINKASMTGLEAQVPSSELSAPSSEFSVPPRVPEIRVQSSAFRLLCSGAD